jgi:hypothetical protein
MATSGLVRAGARDAYPSGLSRDPFGLVDTENCTSEKLSEEMNAASRLAHHHSDSETPDSAVRAIPPRRGVPTRFSDESSSMVWIETNPLLILHARASNLPAPIAQTRSHRSTASRSPNSLSRCEQHQRVRHQTIPMWLSRLWQSPVA